MARVKPNRFRRGVLLLVIMGLLAMFGLVAIAFVVLSSQADRSAKTAARVDLAAESGTEDTDRAMMQALIGSDNPASAIGPHGLLEDVYGETTENRYRTVLADTLGVRSIAAGQLVEFGVALLDRTADTNAPRYVGSVVTFTSGNCKGQSTRIVGYNTFNGRVQILAEGAISPSAVAPGDQFLVNEPAFSGTGAGFNPDTGAVDFAVSVGTNDLEVALLPNLRGADADTSRIDADDWYRDDGDGYGGDRAGWGGANEDYDAVDFQNMMLAGVIPNPAGGPGVVIPSLHRPELCQYWTNRLQGSFTEANWNALSVDVKRMVCLRPLLDDHPNFTGSNPKTFRPWWDGFTDSNLYSWDVDNDGDGVYDSIWVDAGFPVRSTADGRLYKPLVAILCLDLDGRLNVNAHGTYAQTQRGNTGLPAPLTDYFNYYGTNFSGSPVPNVEVGPEFWYATNSATAEPRAVVLPRGQGWGPAEVNLLPLFQDATAGTFDFEQYKALLCGSYLANGSAIDGRYGESYLLREKRSNGGWTELGLPGPGVTPLASETLGRTAHWGDPLSWNQHQGYPTAYGNLAATSLYQCIPDWKGTFAMGLDPRGQVLYAPPLSGVVAGRAYPLLQDATIQAGDDSPYGETVLASPFANWIGVNHPYEFDPSAAGKPQEYQWSSGISTVDHPFNVAEMERIVRQYDADAPALPERLEQLAPALLDHRFEFTVESRDVPSPALAPTAEMLEGMASKGMALRPAHVLDLLRSRMNDTAFNSGWAKLLPPDLLSGRKMDLNMPFGVGHDAGDGVDNDSNGVVDDWSERGTDANMNGVVEDMLEAYAGYPGVEFDRTGNAVTVGYDSSNGFDINGDGTYNATDRTLVRQLYARYLYVLAWLVTDPDAQWPDPSQAAGTADQLSKKARLLAQWAVNVADYRDRDSIMTCFEYDPDPLTSGWRVDGNAATDDSITEAHVVWGCERPELLITETLAWHARHTTDTKTDDGIGDSVYDPDDTANPDIDFDQERRPEGPLFIELYNPWHLGEPVPGDLYDRTYGGVDLTRVTPTSGGGAPSPVWRMVVIPRDPDDENDADLDRDPDHADVNERPNLTAGGSAPTRARIVYFADIAAATDYPATEGDLRYYPGDTQRGLIAPIKPGRYAVVGPAEGGSTGAQTTYISVPSGRLDPAGTDNRRIVLNPSANPETAGTLGVYSNPSVNDLSGVTIQPVVAIGIDNVIGSGGASPAVPPRLSLTEPADGYPATDSAGGNYNQSTCRYTVPFDKPLDRQANQALWDNVLKDTGTFTKFAVVHLQRLANPLVPYNANTNPYRTIDSAPVDLNTFNGVEARPDVGTAVNEETDAGTSQEFLSRERGDSLNTGSGRTNVPNNLWTQESPDTGADFDLNDHTQQNRTPAGSTTHVFNEALNHTLGYLNDPYGLPQSGDPLGDGTPSAVVRGDPVAAVGSTPYGPFPWLAWNNRPFINQYELLLVPAVRSSRLLNHPELRSVAGGWTEPLLLDNRVFGVAENLADSPYAEGYPYDGDIVDRAFPHLLEFCQANATSPSVSPQLCRLLDFVYVPSRFAGTSTLLNPTTFDDANDQSNGLMHWFHPPFNQVSNYREPGRVNLNTVFSEAVWQGLINCYPAMDPTATPWLNDEVAASRRGYSAASIAVINPTYPTRFGQPYRSAAAANLVPIAALRQNSGTPRRPIDATLLRSQSMLDAAADPDPLLQLTTPPATEWYRDTNRNATFRYEPMQRLGNLVTGHSNVYAVWITVGYFEVTPAPSVDASRWPDGYQLGRELGLDSGDVKRHRAFYIIDRSIPVGFRRGQDLNAEKTILLKRTIE